MRVMAAKRQAAKSKLMLTFKHWSWIDGTAVYLGAQKDENDSLPQLNVPPTQTHRSGPSVTPKPVNATSANKGTDRRPPKVEVPPDPRTITPVEDESSSGVWSDCWESDQQSENEAGFLVEGVSSG